MIKKSKSIIYIIIFLIILGFFIIYQLNSDKDILIKEVNTNSIISFEGNYLITFQPSSFVIDVIDVNTGNIISHKLSKLYSYVNSYRYNNSYYLFLRDNNKFICVNLLDGSINKLNININNNSLVTRIITTDNKTFVYVMTDKDNYSYGNQRVCVYNSDNNKTIELLNIQTELESFFNKYKYNSINQNKIVRLPFFIDFTNKGNLFVYNYIIGNIKIYNKSLDLIKGLDLNLISSYCDISYDKKYLMLRTIKSSSNNKIKETGTIKIPNYGFCIRTINSIADLFNNDKKTIVMELLNEDEKRNIFNTTYRNIVLLNLDTFNVDKCINVLSAKESYINFTNIDSMLLINRYNIFYPRLLTYNYNSGEIKDINLITRSSLSRIYLHDNSVLYVNEKKKSDGKSILYVKKHLCH